MDREVYTGWVEPPFETGGLDHLGVQAPCIQIYGQLLPGITNVTDRARYYSFYLWLFNEFEKKGWREKNEVIQQLRKADCLFSLISIRHGQSHDNYGDHAGAAVGSNTLTSIISDLAKTSSIKLSTCTHLEDDKPYRYFKNPYGGFGQYYFGALEELRLMSGDSVSDARLIRETGAKIASAMSLGVRGEFFMQVLEADVVSLSNLDELSSFCHCQLTTSEKEVSLLINLFREGWPAITDDKDSVDTVEDKAASIARSKSLAILIKFSGFSAESKKQFNVQTFRGMSYSQTGFENQNIQFSDELSVVADYWQVYQRNEVLAVAMQGLFFSMLKAMDLDASANVKRFMNTRELAYWFWHEGPGSLVIKNENADNLGDLLIQRCAALPEFGNWCHKQHEIQLIETVVEQTHQTSLGTFDIATITSNSLDILAAICCRKENEIAYGDVQFRAGYLEPYPVNLNSVPTVVNHTLKNLDLEAALVKFTTHCCLDNHLGVAMRKLRQQGKNTSRFSVTEHGIVIKEIPAATHTSPRFSQSMRILSDLGLVQKEGEILLPSESGLAFMSAVS